MSDSQISGPNSKQTTSSLVKYHVSTNARSPLIETKARVFFSLFKPSNLHGEPFSFDDGNEFSEILNFMLNIQDNGYDEWFHWNLLRQATTLQYLTQVTTPKMYSYISSKNNLPRLQVDILQRNFVIEIGEVCGFHLGH